MQNVAHSHSLAAFWRIHIIRAAKIQTKWWTRHKILNHSGCRLCVFKRMQYARFALLPMSMTIIMIGTETQFSEWIIWKECSLHSKYHNSFAEITRSCAAVRTAENRKSSRRVWAKNVNFKVSILMDLFDYGIFPPWMWVCNNWIRREFQCNAPTDCAASEPGTIRVTGAENVQNDQNAMHPIRS